MEKQGSVVNGGGIKLPIGYRFRPTDEELIVHYLKRKVFGIPLPASVIPELDVFHSHPSSLLSGNSREKRYFFCNREGSGDDNNSDENGVVDSLHGRGYWKYTGKARHMIVSSPSPSPSFNCQLVGMRRSLVFRRHKKASAHHNNASRQPQQQTQWVMHEFCLVGLATIPFTNQVTKVKLGDWVLCTVFERKNRRPTNPTTTTTNKKKNLQGVDTSNCSPIPSQPQVDEETIINPDTDNSSMDFRMEELSDAGPVDLQEEDDEEEEEVPCSSSSSPYPSETTALSTSPTKSPNGGGLDHLEDVTTPFNAGLCSSSSTTTSTGSYFCKRKRL